VVCSKVKECVFLSHQWDKQPEVQYLYKLLTAMGYSCWMDIYEMGGGDSLFDAIDKGIRKSKVVVSHVTSKYALSANCRREVSLSDAIKKPIIPLLLDNMTWPPEGPMSMVFTQLLYIDFKDNSASAQQLWSGPRLDQLITKIDGHLGRSKTRPALAKKADITGPVQPTNTRPPSAKAYVAPPMLQVKSQPVLAVPQQPVTKPADKPNSAGAEKPVVSSSVHVSSKPVADNASRWGSASKNVSHERGVNWSQSCIIS
jgi:hypothetical protein